MKTASEIQRDITKDIHISILKDTLADLRSANQMFKRIIYTLCFIIILTIFGIVFQGTYYQHKLFTFMETAEFSSEVNMINDDSNSNNMNVDRR